MPSERGDGGHTETESKPGHIAGRHFTEYVEEVKQLKREDRLAEAEALLLQLVEATEADAAFHKWGVAPWYYEELAKIYRKQKEYAKEVYVLTRYIAQRHGPGDSHRNELRTRMEKAKELFLKNR